MENKRIKQVLSISFLILIIILGYTYITNTTSWRTYQVTSTEYNIQQIWDGATDEGLTNVLDKIMTLSYNLDDDQNNHYFNNSDFHELQNFLINNHDKKVLKIILSKKIVYFLEVVRDNKFFSFMIKPISYNTYFSNNLNNLFLFRKEKNEVLPEQIVNYYDSNQTKFWLTGIQIHLYRKPSFHFKYWPEEKEIKIIDTKKEMVIKEIQVKMTVNMDLYWARSYVVDYSPTKYTYRIGNDLNLSVLHANHQSMIKYRKYLYDISIFSKSTSFVQLQKEESVHIHSSFGIKDINSVDYVTELITNNSENHSPSFYIAAEVSVEAY